MPREICPSSYLCDCGHVSHLTGNTIREAKEKSLKRVIRLLDSAENEHTIVFHKGKVADIICPRAAGTPHNTEACEWTAHDPGERNVIRGDRDNTRRQVELE